MICVSSEAILMLRRAINWALCRRLAGNECLHLPMRGNSATIGLVIVPQLVLNASQRERTASFCAGLALLETALDVPGSIALPPQLAARIAESIRTRRAQAVAMVCISVDDHPERTRRALPSDSSHVGFLDAFSDCSGWLDRQAVAVAGCPSCSATLRDGGIDRLERALAEHPHVVAASRGSSVSRSMVLFVNSVR